MEQLKGGPKEPLMMSGPKFGDNRGWWSRFRKWAGENRSNVILTVIGILIIAGGIYLYSNYQKSNQPGNTEVQTSQQQNDQGAVKPEQVNIDGQTNQQTPSVFLTVKAVKAEVIKHENAKYTVKANKGAGVTHLARAAVKAYLEANQELKQNITPEHKIYIEDYLKRKTSSSALALGQELTFDDNLIKEAIDNSQKLNQAQLQNLHKYVLLAPSLSG